MINGAHVVISSTNAEADRAFLREHFDLPHVDVGHGWLIFGLPPSELAVHPAETSGKHELFFMCENVDTFVEQMTAKGIACAAIDELSWGRLSRITLPGGGEVGVYEPKHERPPS